MAPPRRAARRRRSVTIGWTAVLALALLLTAGAVRSCGARPGPSGRPIDPARASAVGPLGTEALGATGVRVGNDGMVTR